MESHHIMPCGSLTYAPANTAGRELHPAPKNFSLILFTCTRIPWKYTKIKLYFYSLISSISVRFPPKTFNKAFSDSQKGAKPLKNTQGFTPFFIICRSNLVWLAYSAISAYMKYQ